MLLAYFCPSWVSFASYKLDYQCHKHDLFVKKNYTPCLCFSCHLLLYCCIPHSQSISCFPFSCSAFFTHQTNRQAHSSYSISHCPPSEAPRRPTKSLRGEDNVSDLSCTLHHHPKPFWQNTRLKWTLGQQHQHGKSWEEAKWPQPRSLLPNSSTLFWFWQNRAPTLSPLGLNLVRELAC